MRWDLIIMFGGSFLILGLGAWQNHRNNKQRPSGWFEEDDFEHQIDDFRWLPEEVREYGK